MLRTITQSANYKWWAFATIAIGVFMSGASQGSAVVIMPNIARHFAADLSTVQWVVVGNILVTSVLLLPMGRLSDIIDRKRVYSAGFAIFVDASALAGFSPNLAVLVIARILQGVGSAMIQANMTAMIISVFPEGERGKAIGAQMSVMGMGMIGGPALGGLLVNALGWRSIFLINIPVGVVGVAAAMFILNKSQFVTDIQAGQRPSFDWQGAVLSSGALLFLLVAISMGNRIGWGSGAIISGLVASVIFLGALIWGGLRTTSPMLDLRLLKRRLVAFGVTAGWLSFVGTSSVMFLLPFYLQDVLGHNAGEVGLFIMAPALGMTIFGPIGGRLSDRFGWRKFTVGGLALMAGMILTFSAILDAGTSVALIIPLFAVGGIGAGLFSSANQSSILGAVERTEYGVISALIHLARTSGNVFGVSLATVIVVATMGSMGVEPSLAEVSTDGGSEIADAFVSGLHRAFMILGSLLLVALVLSLWKGELAEEAPAPARQTRVSGIPSD